MLSFASADELFAACTVLFVAGKGGVGKTTVGATVAIAAARRGCDVVLIELEGYSSLSAMFELDAADITLGYEPAEVDCGAADGGRLRVAHLRPDDALTRFLSASGLGPIVSSLSRAGAIEIVASATPGIRDLVTLGRIRQMEQAGVADLIVIDAPASGHTVPFSPPRERWRTRPTPDR